MSVLYETGFSVSCPTVIRHNASARTDKCGMAIGSVGLHLLLINEVAFSVSPVAASWRKESTGSAFYKPS